MLYNIYLKIFSEPASSSPQAHHNKNQSHRKRNDKIQEWRRETKTKDEFKETKLM